MLVREARRYGPGQVLVVMQKAVKESLLDLGPLPSNIELAHHNGVAGMDCWRNVSCLITVGRTQPPVGAVERMAEGLTGKAMAAPADWYDRADAMREMADGSTLPAEADRHPDPIAESLRWQIAEGELVQIIGRGRGVNRTEANPLTVLVLTDLPIPMPLAGTLAAKEMEPCMADHMMGDAGLVLENTRHASAAFPKMWPTHQSARNDLQRERERSVPFSYRESLTGKRYTPRFTYLVKGAGQKPVAGFYDPGMCPNPEAFIRAALGDLAWFRIDGEGDEPEPPKPNRKRKSDQVEPESAMDSSDDVGTPGGLDDTREPPAGHPAWEQAPVEDWGAWVPGEYEMMLTAEGRQNQTDQLKQSLEDLGTGLRSEITALRREIQQQGRAA